MLDGTDPTRVPLNICRSTAITPAALGYVQTAGFQSGQPKEKVVNASVTFQGAEYGVQSPLASQGIAINIGGEYRKESLTLEVDNGFRTGDLAGQGGSTLPINGSPSCSTSRMPRAEPGSRTMAPFLASAFR